MCPRCAAWSAVRRRHKIEQNIEGRPRVGCDVQRFDAKTPVTLENITDCPSQSDWARLRHAHLHVLALGELLDEPLNEALRRRTAGL